MLQKQTPERNEAYREFIRNQPCCICSRTAHLRKDIRRRLRRGGQCSHVGRTGKGMGQKCSDYESVPKCASHHRELHDKGKRKFALKYGIQDIETYFREVWVAYNEIWLKDNSTLPQTNSGN